MSIYKLIFLMLFWPLIVLNPIAWIAILLNKRYGFLN